MFKYLLFPLMFVAGFANAELYKIYLGTPAGSMSDAQVRKIIPYLEQKTQDTFIVINKPGADQLVAYKEFIEESRTNPNVIYLGGTGTHVSSYILYPDLKLDPLRDTKSLFLLSPIHYSICALQNSNLTGLQDIRGRLNIGSGNGSSALIFDRMKFDSDVHLIPFKDDKSGFVSLMSGDIHAYMCININPLFNANKDKIKTVANFDKQGFVGAIALFVPRNFSDSKTKQLNYLLNQAINDPEIRQWFIDTSGVPAAGGPPESLDRIIRNFRKQLN